MSGQRCASLEWSRVFGSAQLQSPGSGSRSRCPGCPPRGRPGRPRDQRVLEPIDVLEHSRGCDCPELRCEPIGRDQGGSATASDEFAQVACRRVRARTGVQEVTPAVVVGLPHGIGNPRLCVFRVIHRHGGVIATVQDQRGVFRYPGREGVMTWNSDRSRTSRRDSSRQLLCPPWTSTTGTPRPRMPYSTTPAAVAAIAQPIVPAPCKLRRRG
jgi:hypothetical protein